MIRHHCGAENAENAKFCKQCGEKLTPPEAAPADEQKICPQCQAANRSAAKFCAKCGYLFAPAAGPQPTRAGAAPEPAPEAPIAVRPEPKRAGTDAMPMPAAPKQNTSSRNALIAVALIAVLLLSGAAGAAWWLWGGGKDKRAAAETAVSQPAVTQEEAKASVPAPEPASASAEPPTVAQEPPAPREPSAEEPPPSVAAPTVVPDLQSEQARREERLRLQREEKARRRAELAAQRRAEEEDRRRAIQERRREPVQRVDPDETIRRPPPRPMPPVERLSPQQACADRPNFISRGLCESRECAKPERMNHPYCIEMRERQSRRNDF